MKNWFNNLDSKTQVFVVILGLVLVIYIFKIGKAYMQRAGEIANNIGETAALQAQGLKATFTKAKYNDFANQLENAMRGIGTNSNVVFSIFSKMKNDIDIIKLDESFGLRESWGSSYNLGEWLRADLSNSEMNQLNTDLSSKGITKQF